MLVSGRPNRKKGLLYSHLMTKEPTQKSRGGKDQRPALVGRPVAGNQTIPLSLKKKRVVLKERSFCGLKKGENASREKRGERKRDPLTKKESGGRERVGGRS